MTASELKRNVDSTGSFFFSRETMRFFGDTMKNYKVVARTVDTTKEKAVDVWELRRKAAVKHGLRSSAYFRMDNFKRVFRG